MTTALTAENNVQKKGPLHIQWGVRKKLHLRFIVLKKNGEVSIWMSNNLNNPKKNRKHTFFLTGEESLITKRNKSKMFRFKINMINSRQNKPFYTFGCGSSDTRAAWMSSFSAVLHGLVLYSISQKH